MKRFSEIANRYLTDLIIDDATLETLKAITLDMMSDLHAICEREGLRYSMAFGTMLGAVRHGGFIPWDDDIDVMMPREDYEKLRSLIRSDAQGKYCFVDRADRKDYCLHFGKMIHKEHTLIELANEQKIGINGVFLDIFPLDDMPRSRIKQTFYRKTGWLFYRLACLESEYRYFPKTLRERCTTDRELRKYFAKRRVAGFFASVLPIRAWTKLGELSSRCCKHPTEFYWCGEKLKPIARGSFDKRILYRFQDRSFYGLEDSDSYLTSLYGETYLQIPPKEKQIKHMLIEFTPNGGIK